MTIMPQKKRIGFGAIVAHTVLIVASLGTIIPFLYLVSMSLRYFKDIISGAFLFTPTLVNYQRLFSGESDFPLLLWNSVVISVLATIICLLVGTIAAYAITRFTWNPWIPRLLLGWLVIVQTIPSISLVGPFYFLGLQTGLYNTRTLLVLVYVLLSLPLVVWMMIAYYQSLPRDLEEAAIIDGCSWWQVFFRIVVPISTPAIAASGVLAFVFSWKEFLLALSLTSTATAMTLPVGIAGFVQDFSINYGEMSAAAAIAIVPGLLLAVFAQRYIVSGLTSGAVKN